MDLGGDSGDRAGFHRGEAISAVQDEEPYYGEDDDYDDLYNDVNVGEGFLPPLQQPPAADPPSVPFNRDGVHPHPQPHPPPPVLAAAPPAMDPPEKSQIPGILDRSAGFGGVPAVAPRPLVPIGGARPDLGQSMGRPAEIQGQVGSYSGGEGFQRPVVAAAAPVAAGNGRVDLAGGGEAAGGTATLFVGELHWWTTDADLEAELCKYGQVKEVRFFDEKASGKSKGYCQVDFYDPAAAAGCKEGMNGYLFNGRPCVVALSSPWGVRRMGEAQVNKNQGVSQPNMPQRGRGGGGGGGGGPAVGSGNFGGGGGGGGGRGGNWGRGGMGNRGHMGNARNRMGPVGGRGIIGNGGMAAQPPPMMHPGAMMGQAFDPTGYGAAMGRIGAGYGGFPAGPAGPFPGMMPSFTPVVAPHLNPAFFGRGMAPSGAGMWPDPNMGGWGGEEQSSYGEDAASDHQYGGASHVKDRGQERERSGAPERRLERDNDMGPERRHRDDREMGRERDRDWEREREREREREKERERDRDRYRDDRDRHGDYHRHRDREPGGRSRSREVEHSKRHRVSSD